MTTPDLSRAMWRTSTHSSGNGGQCVEVAQVGDQGIAVRDSKNRTGPTLVFTATAWVSFIAATKGGAFDR